MLENIVQSLKALLEKKFRTVRVSAMQTSEQFLRELKAVNRENLPGVIIVFDGLSNLSETATGEINLTLVLIDRFKAGSDERALSLYRAAGELLELFPPDGMDLDGVHVHPVDLIAASPDPELAALGLGIKCKL